MCVCVCMYVCVCVCLIVPMCRWKDTQRRSYFRRDLMKQKKIESPSRARALSCAVGQGCVFFFSWHWVSHPGRGWGQAGVVWYQKDMGSRSTWGRRQLTQERSTRSRRQGKPRGTGPGSARARTGELTATPGACGHTNSKVEYVGTRATKQ